MSLRRLAQSIPATDIPQLRAWIGEALREAGRRAARLTRAVDEGLIPATGETMRALDRFNRALEREGEREYLRHHARLPGSTRTARLRKKRTDLVMRAFWKG